MVIMRSFPGYFLSLRSSSSPLSCSLSTSPSRPHHGSLPPASSQPPAVGTAISSSSLLASTTSSSTLVASLPSASCMPLGSALTLASSSSGSAISAPLAPTFVILSAAPIPEDAEEWSDEDSNSECETDSSNDKLHSYKHPVPSGDDLRIYLHPEDLTWGCPVYPNKGPQWETIDALRDHVVG
ncbi:hypothetical protein HU200_038408 [Digitaria exilis]|uniref:Uncharacterized protein n=1 Tax=Digitaria exilis TaxID=1010633 RepID=A0A835BCX2_9POAL|nr:hypothetical protein HU200_038408 [Digitaria exilis]